MSTVLLDTHTVHWWSAEPARLSAKARAAIDDADVRALSAISWFELARLAARGRIGINRALPDWLRELSARLITIPITPELAAAAAELPKGVPSDPADRLIFATALAGGMTLVTKDRALRAHGPRIAIW